MAGSRCSVGPKCSSACTELSALSGGFAALMYAAAASGMLRASDRCKARCRSSATLKLSCDTTGLVGEPAWVVWYIPPIHYQVVVKT
jgi:hypothetical protein